MSRAAFGIPLIQLKRHNAIVRLMDEIERGLTPAVDRHPARFIFREQLHEADPTKCAVCTVPLIGRQRHFCSGHWDYAIADVKLNQPYGRVLKSLAIWLRENLQNPRITRHSHYWLGVLKGAFRCEVCDRSTDLQEVLESNAQQWLKQHTVCTDHASFRGDWSGDGSR